MRAGIGRRTRCRPRCGFPTDWSALELIHPSVTSREGPAHMLFRATFIASAIATAAIGWASPASSAPPCPMGQYRDRPDHTCIPHPTAAPTPPPGARALCRDGDYSFRQTRMGTCNGHDGVAQWLP
jgi:hypothetical protein